MTFGLSPRSTADAPAANAVTLRIHLLGGFRVEPGARDMAPSAELAWRPKSAALVKLLALAPDYHLHREQVQEALWPELAPAAAANNLHRTLYAARRTLAPAAPSPYLRLRGDQLILG